MLRANRIYEFRNRNIQILLQLITVRDISFHENSRLSPERGEIQFLLIPWQIPQGDIPRKLQFPLTFLSKTTSMDVPRSSLCRRDIIYIYIYIGSGETLDVPLTEALSASKAGGLLGILI